MLQQITFFLVMACLVGPLPGVGQENQVLSFDNLFQELQGEGRSSDPQDTQSRREGVATDFDRIVADRNAVVTRDGGLFKAINDTLVAEREFGIAQGKLNAAAAALQKAQAWYAREQQTSLRVGKETLAFASAEAAVGTAQTQARAARAEFDRRANELAASYERLRRDIPRFLALYNELRRLVPHARGSVNKELVALFQKHERDCPEWIEGFMVAALARAYDGEDEEAAALLERAGEVMANCKPLIGSILAEDCCSTWLLLGRPDKVARYVAEINRRHAKYRTAMQEWLLGAHARVRGRHSEATKLLTTAMNKAKKNAPPALIAEAALAQLLSDPTGRRTAKAADLLEQLEGNDSWPVLQSRAALAAAESRWGDALHLVEQCRAKAPPCLFSELDAQQASYEAEKIWQP